MKNDDHDQHDDDQEDDEFEADSEPGDVPVYLVDDDTRALIEVSLNCMVQLSEAQIDESGAEALLVIADSLAERFAINRFEVEETIHTDEDGEEEIIYKPKGGIMPDTDDEE